MQKLLKLMKEPLVHFILIGVALFVLFGFVSPKQRNSDTTLIVTAARQENIGAQFEATRKRPPTAEELEFLIQNYLREEVLYRQAVELGLDRDDTVVRGRMKQKMEFFAESGARLLVPTDTELQEILDREPEKFIDPSRIAFRQVFLGENPAAGEVNATMAALTGIGGSGEFREIGKPTLLPAQLPLSNTRTIDSIFGPDFTTALVSANPGTWVGPVPSAYGLHFILVTEQTKARQFTVDDIRDVLIRDWRAAKSQELKDRQFNEQLSRYEVIIEPGGEQ